MFNSVKGILNILVIFIFTFIEGVIQEDGFISNSIKRLLIKFFSLHNINYRKLNMSQKYTYNIETETVFLHSKPNV